MKIDKENINDYIGKIEMVTQLQLRNLSDLLTQLMTKDLQVSTFARAAYSLNNFITEEVKAVESSLQNKNIKLFMHLPDYNIEIQKNQNNISLAFQNLRSNAIKFSFNNGEIHIYTRQKEGVFEIEVLDEGLGFPENYQQYLFKDVRKTGRKGINDEPSVSLGLHLSKKVIENLGRTLSATSLGEGKGASFKITL